MGREIRINVPLTLHFYLPPLLRQYMGALEAQAVRAHFPQTLQRVQDLGTVAQNAWRQRISRLPGTEGRPLSFTADQGRMLFFNRRSYADSVLIAPLEWEPDGVDIVIYSDDPQAELIEDGVAEMDLHHVLSYAPKARRNGDGKLYLRIPIRHTTQSSEGGSVLPAAVVSAMRSKPKYLMTGTYYERGPNVRKGLVQRYLYTARPGRLTMGEIATLNERHRQRHRLPATHQGPPVPALIPGPKHLKGLMRTGRAGHGGYLTIRTLSEANPGGWRVPAYAPQQLLEAVRQDIVQAAPTFFEEAIQADMAGIVASAGGVG